MMKKRVIMPMVLVGLGCSLACSFSVGTGKPATWSSGEQRTNSNSDTPCKRQAIHEGICDASETRCLEAWEQQCSADVQERERIEEQMQEQKLAELEEKRAAEKKQQQIIQEAEAAAFQRRLVEQQRETFTADCRAKGGEFGDNWAAQQTKTWTEEVGTVCPEPSEEFVAAQTAEAAARKKAAEGAERRRAFADAADERALKEGWNHNGFWTTGDEDVVLVLEYWRCNRQYLYQMVNGLRKKLHELGFKQVDCDNGVSRWFEHVEK